MIKPVGGRGKKAPYETVVLRVPKDLVLEFELRIEEYRESMINQIDNKSLGLLNKDKAIEEAKRILLQRKAAKVSLTKLLQVLYNDKNIII